MDITFVNIGIGVAGIIIGALVPIALHKYSKKNKKMKFVIYTYPSLFNIEGDLKIYYKDELIRNNISIMDIEIVNSGNVPIESNDVVNHLRFIFNENDNIINCFVCDKNPISVIAHVYNPREYIKTCLFALLNPKDSIKLRFIAQSHEIHIPKIEVHIIDCKLEIENRAC